MQFFYLLWQKKVTFRMTKCENENPKQSKVILRWFITYDTILILFFNFLIFKLFAFCLINYKKQSALVRAMLIIMITVLDNN